MQKHEENLAARINGNNLQPLAGASVTVTNNATGLPASLYQDDEVTPITSIVTDNNGYYGFKAPDGEYTLTFSGVRFATFTRQLILDDPSENPYATLAQLASPSGASLVNYGDGPVSEHLDLMAGPAPIAEADDLGYCGNKSTMPVLTAGALLVQQVWKTPVHIDLSHLENPALPEVGPVFKFGNTGVTQGAFWSQDSYQLRNGTFVDGPPETVSFEPFTGHTAKVEGLRILNSGAPNKWHVNFKQQNWWPIVSDCVYADYTDKKGNFFKAIDDEGNPALRYSGNTRVVFQRIRCKWLGSLIGGTGFYGSGVGNVLRDVAMEGAGIGAILGYPSTGTLIDGFYSEMPFGGQVAIMLGDPTAAPVNNISLIKASTVYANMHGLGSNRVFKAGNAQVVINDMTADKIFVTNIPALSPPLFDMPDLPGHKIRAGHIDASDMPLVPLLQNHVAIIDSLGATIPTFNGDMVFADSNAVALSAGVAAPIARNWFAKSSAAGTFNRSASGSARPALRQSRYIGVLGLAAGSTNVLACELPRANQYAGEVLTVQVLLNSSVPITHSLKVRIYNPDGSRTTLRDKSVTSEASWAEHTATFYVDSSANEEGSMLVLELTNTTASAATLNFTGVRFNRGAFGLSSRADTYSYAEVEAQMPNHTWIAP